MSENAERLRKELEDNAIVGYGKDRAWWDSLPKNQQYIEVANTGMGSSFGYIKAIRDPDNRYSAHDLETLQMVAKTHGFDSVDEYITVLVELREELRGQLSPEDWDIFFGRTLDIT